jgi:hypothetical protein
VKVTFLKNRPELGLAGLKLLIVIILLTAKELNKRVSHPLARKLLAQLVELVLINQLTYD